jgi:hypothetical protein
MALTTITLRFNSNVFMPTPSPGDVIHVIYDVSVDADPNAYPAGGEPIDFSNEFAEVHSVIGDLALAPPAVGQADGVGAMVPVFQRAAAPNDVNQGTIRFYQGGGAGANLAELTVGAYPNTLVFALMVHGRPITDAQ